MNNNSSKTSTKRSMKVSKIFTKRTKKSEGLLLWAEWFGKILNILSGLASIVQMFI